MGRRNPITVTIMPGPSIASQVRRAASRFPGANQGNIAVLFGVALLPILGFMGAAIDYTRANSARSSMQAALDSTALMLAKDLADGRITVGEISAKATAYFTALYTNKDAKSVTINATYTASSSQGSTILVNGFGNVTTEFMKVAGFPKLDFNTSSTAAWGNVRMRVAIALDVTGSMDKDGKMDALKPAAKSLIDQLSALAKNPGDVYVSIIPFAKDVNVGASNYDANWLNWSDWDNDNRTCNGGGWGANCTPKDHSTWNGCVTDRDQSYDTLNTAPTGGPSTRFYAEQYDACPAQIMPLSTEFAALKTKIDSLTPNGGTNQPIGIAWGWQSLTQGAPLNAPAEEANYTYKKVLIVMSDGLNTQDRWPSYGNGHNQFSGQIDARQRILCDNAKAAGVVIYAMHVNTDNDPTSAVLQYCASGADKFSTVTSSSQIAAAFTAIGTSLSKLRVAK